MEKTITAVRITIEVSSWQGGMLSKRETETVDLLQAEISPPVYDYVSILASSRGHLIEPRPTPRPWQGPGLTPAEGEK